VPLGLLATTLLLLVAMTVHGVVLELLWRVMMG
jgi:hypothetical protein